ncbi:UDP-N-acetylglucosamine 1-carboxyvinyltransferase [candidate division WWE3 bacterium]|uniref:UDP-N-acetylglucosamine 1-carboxyvinyltransferase n=1 Tax=candidate division WWE3 bacterium TaxID=2053526 RepID=A0A955LHD4_UNCKA|nr:UDP-N-acetylglucosamine 1-carboxyvinyltransferase [candidate division WWE3 bacterium]
MSDIRIIGGNSLNGTITPSGNKNAALPMLCATVLTDETVVLENVPDISDINKIVALLAQLGSKINWNKESQTITINNKNLSLDRFDGKIPFGMRASLLLLSPLLYRFKTIIIDNQVGGCTLGIRDFDPYINMLKDLGGTVTKKDGQIVMSIEQTFKPNQLWPNYASVTSTENIIMAAVVADGETTLMNAASEPHVQDLCHMLVSMGAEIDGIGSSKLIVSGKHSLSGATARVSSDHQEIATFLALGAMTNGRIAVEDALPEHFPLIISEFKKLGVAITFDGNTAIVEKNQSFEPEKPFTENYIPRIEAAPWPYFPVDILPLMIALSLKTKGPTRFWNKVYEGGMFWVTEFLKMNVRLEIMDPHRIIVLGPTEIKAANLQCPGIIRATVALMMAAMAAEGTSTLQNIDTIYRAHPNFIENLESIGANIEYIDTPH